MKMKVYATVVVAVFWFGCGWCAHSGRGVYAQEHVIIVRGEGVYPPNEMLMNGELAGIHIDLIRAVADVLDLRVTFQSLPWKTAIAMLESGQADAITYLNPTPEREQFAIFLDGNTLSEKTFVLVARPDVAALIDSPFDSERLKRFGPIGIRTADNIGPQAARLEGLPRYEADSLPQLITLLRSGELALAVMCWQEVRDHYATTMLMDELTPISPPIYSTKAYIAFSKVRQREDLAQQFARALHHFKQTPHYSRLLHRYQMYPQQALTQR
jgi:polar amino acid transport system substrate-binding protein